jgi:hypothetical protein
MFYPVIDRTAEWRHQALPTRMTEPDRQRIARINIDAGRLRAARQKNRTEHPRSERRFGYAVIRHRGKQRDEGIGDRNPQEAGSMLIRLLGSHDPDDSQPARVKGAM